MNRFFTKTKVLIGFALAMLGIGTYAVAQPFFSPRIFQTQQTHYLRIGVPFNLCPLTLAAPNCSVRVGALPYNAFLVRAIAQTQVSFGAASPIFISLGTGTTVAAAPNIISSFSAGVNLNGLTVTLSATTIGTTQTGNLATQTGTLGGFDVFAQLQLLAAVPTAGFETIILEYIAPNDGTCVAVPMGATSAGC